MRARLLIAPCTAIASEASDALLAGTLTTQMIARLAGGAHGMTVTA